MTCPICSNPPGRCPHTLSERTNAAFARERVNDAHRKGRIDISEATRQHNAIGRQDWKTNNRR